MYQTILEEMDAIEKGEAYLMDEHFYNYQTDKPKLPNYNSCAMTPEEFMAKMRYIHDEYEDDPEMCHIYMDKLMCGLLINLGYWEGIHIFNNTKMWYA